jgi:hypothetical protein
VTISQPASGTATGLRLAHSGAGPACHAGATDRYSSEIGILLAAVEDFTPEQYYSLVIWMIVRQPEATCDALARFWDCERKSRMSIAPVRAAQPTRGLPCETPS